MFLSHLQRCIFTMTAEGNKNKSTFSYLRMLTAWHCPHLPTACRCCSNQSISPACWAHSSKPASVDRRADRLKDTKHFTDPAQTSEHIQFYFLVLLFFLFFAVGSVLQCFDAVGWVAGRASGLKKQSGGVLARLSVWSEVQTCIWSSWYHCHSLSLAPVKSRLVLPFWYRLTQVVLEKRPLNGCSSCCWFSVVTSAFEHTVK